jgi:2-polyprenyl-6-methoxyphenol hydroxylase-like FAD-dependent oxidoreductase
VEEYDAIVVGARCGGATLANALARRDWSVLLVDKDEFPSTTISTHGLWPPGLARLEQLGVLDRLLAKHELPMYQSRIYGLGHETIGGFTAVDGFESAAAPRRIVLDQAGIEAALAAGATGRFGKKVVDLLGTGSEEDPVRGVVLEDGERVGARWVLGADGRGSAVARILGVPKERPMKGEMSMAYGYWRGIPDTGYGTFHIELDRVLTSVSVEDDLHMLIMAGPPEMVRGTKAERRRRYLELASTFPETISPTVLDGAELVTDVAIAPESLMRGFYRRPAGPGWALVGDACHFKHPGTAQGIGDALEQAIYVADAISGADPGLEGYEAWRDARAAEYYEWSFSWGHFPRPENEAVFRGWASEPDAGQDVRDTFSRLVKPSALMSKERLARWFGGSGLSGDEIPASSGSQAR